MDDLKKEKEGGGLVHVCVQEKQSGKLKKSSQQIKKTNDS